MAVEITQSQYNVSNQTLRNLHIKINLLNFQYLTLGSLEGNVTSGNISIDANSDIRRTCDISLVVTDSTFVPQAGGKIFLDRLIQVFTGVDDLSTSETAWTNMGIFLINQPTYKYDATTHTLQFQAVDLMALLSGMRNGVVPSLGGDDRILIAQGANVREQIIGILNTTGFTHYVISECYNSDGTIQEVPNDLEFQQGSTWYDVLCGLRDILPQYQIYFDVDGVFRYEPIPSKATDPIRVGTESWINNVIGEDVSVDFESVKNHIEVYGITHSTDYFCDSEVATVVDNAVTLTISALTSLEDYDVIGFVLPSAATGNITLTVNSFGTYNLVDSNGNSITSLPADEYICASYQAGTTEIEATWLYLGHLQAQGVYEDTNPNSPFYVGSQGENRIVEVLVGGDYESIYSDELAVARARYELYQRCRLKESLTLDAIPIYWLDVNWKTEYRPLGMASTETAKQYIIQSIQIDLSHTGKMTVTLSSFYPDMI